MSQRTFLLVIALCAIALTIAWAPGVVLGALGICIGIFGLYVLLSAIDMFIWWPIHVSRGTVQKVFKDAKGQEVAVVQVGRVRPKSIGVLTWALESEREAAKYAYRALFAPGDTVSIVKRGQRIRAVPRGMTLNYNCPLSCRIFDGWKLPTDERVLTLDVPRGLVEGAQ